MKRLSLLVLLALTAIGSSAQSTSALDDVLQHSPMLSVFALKACDYWADDLGCDTLGSRSSWAELGVTAAASYVASAAVTYSLKQLVRERRPDHSDHRSFPSGHATFAFAGATMLHHEYGHLSPWVTIGGYGMAALVSIDRVRLDRHYLHDVCAGAAIGFLATEAVYALRREFLPRLLGKEQKVQVGFTGQTLEVAIRL